MNTDLIVPETTEMTGFEMKPKTLAEAMRFCEIMADSDLVPKDYKGKPGNIMVAIQLGAELGLTPMRALKSIAVINGRPSMWGDEMLAMVLASPLCEYIDESESTPKEGVCKIKRKGHPEYISRFSLEDARRAGLIGKQGPWTLYEGRMLKLRARGFGIRDKFADKLANLITTEEAMDMPATAPLESKAVSPSSSLKDKLKMKLLEEKPVEQDGASGHAGTIPQEPETRDAAPPLEEPEPPSELPPLNAGNICQQFVLCESVAEWADLANSWQEQAHLHPDEDRARVKKAADAAKVRLTKKR